MPTKDVMEGIQIVSGFEFSQEYRFGPRARRLIAVVKRTGCAYWQIDDGLNPEIQELTAVSGEYFDLVQLDSHQYLLVDRRRCEVRFRGLA
jgi:hypothetical protein